MIIKARFGSKCPKCGQTINVGDEINWEKGQKATHAKCPTKAEKAQYDFPTVKISGGSGYGCNGWTVGQVVKNMETRRREQGEVLPGEELKRINPYWVEVGYRYLYVLETWKRYYREDGLSFGVGDDSGYVYVATCRLATDEESAPLRKEIEAVELRKQAKVELETLLREIMKDGERPTETAIPEGERYFDKQDIYGVGDWFVVGPEWIWYVRNNGMDGDDWSQNNVRTGGAGAIGWRVPRRDHIIARLERIKDVLK